MDNSLKETVLNYISGQDCSPLKFEDYNSLEGEFDVDKKTVESMVKRTLYLTKHYRSMNPETEEIVCSSDRSRSYLDIWRHLKYYRPEISIFEVLRALWNIRANTYSLYCGDVKHRVFKTYYEDNNIYDGKRDEFGLQFKDWYKFAEVEEAV